MDGGAVKERLSNILTQYYQKINVEDLEIRLKVELYIDYCIQLDNIEQYKEIHHVIPRCIAYDSNDIGFNGSPGSGIDFGEDWWDWVDSEDNKLHLDTENHIKAHSYLHLLFREHRGFENSYRYIKRMRRITKELYSGVSNVPFNINFYGLSEAFKAYMETDKYQRDLERRLSTPQFEKWRLAGHSREAREKSMQTKIKNGTVYNGIRAMNTPEAIEKSKKRYQERLEEPGFREKLSRINSNPEKVQRARETFRRNGGYEKFIERTQSPESNEKRRRSISNWRISITASNGLIEKIFYSGREADRYAGTSLRYYWNRDKLLNGLYWKTINKFPFKYIFKSGKVRNFESWAHCCQASKTPYKELYLVKDNPSEYIRQNSLILKAHPEIDC